MSESTVISDKFIEVATQEISKELSDISTILNSCYDDDDVSKNSIKIEKHMHNIKGLAPMMGKENIGNTAKHFDYILKEIISGKKMEGVFEPLCASIEQMRMDIDNSYKMGEMKRQIFNIA